MRRFMKVLGRLLVLSLIGCGSVGNVAPRQSPSQQLTPETTSQQKMAAVMGYRNCLIASAARSDDHMSDASTIAQSMRGSCYSEVLDVARAMTGGGTVRSYYDECNRMIENEYQPELQAVLEERRRAATR